MNSQHPYSKPGLTKRFRLVSEHAKFSRCFYVALYSINQPTLLIKNLSKYFSVRITLGYMIRKPTAASRRSMLAMHKIHVTDHLHVPLSRRSMEFLVLLGIHPIFK